MAAEAPHRCLQTEDRMDLAQSRGRRGKDREDMGRGEAWRKSGGGNLIPSPTPPPPSSPLAPPTSQHFG